LYIGFSEKRRERRKVEFRYSMTKLSGEIDVVKLMEMRYAELVM